MRLTCSLLFRFRLLSKLHLEVLVHGNLTERQALDLTAAVEDRLTKGAGTTPLAKSQLIKHRWVNGAIGQM